MHSVILNLHCSIDKIIPGGGGGGGGGGPRAP